MPAGEDIFRRLGVESGAGDLLPSSVALFPEGQSARALDQYFPRKGILTKEPDHSFGFFYAGAPFAPPRPINSIPRDVIEALLIFLFFAFTLHPSPFSPRLARLRRPKTHGHGVGRSHRRHRRGLRREEAVIRPRVRLRRPPGAVP